MMSCVIAAAKRKNINAAPAAVIFKLILIIRPRRIENRFGKPLMNSEQDPGEPWCRKFLTQAATSLKDHAEQVNRVRGFLLVSNLSLSLANPAEMILERRSKSNIGLVAYLCLS